MSNLEIAEADFARCSNILPAASKTTDLFAPKDVLGLLETFEEFLKEI